jgi:hypothetical protein
MPKGMKGFQPGRKKTGGREKGVINNHTKLTGSLMDQLRACGFNFAKELARGLKALPIDQRYKELRGLLPYMAPQLKDIDPPVEINETQEPITTEALLAAIKPHKVEDEIRERKESFDSKPTGLPEVQSNSKESSSQILPEKQDPNGSIQEGLLAKESHEDSGETEG